VVVPTPTLTELSPDSAEVGTAVTVHVTGSGLMVDSLCLIGGSTLADQALPATLTSGGLDCELDLSVIPPGQYQVWVANPTGSGSPLLSNQLVFDATSNAAPVVDSLAPTAGKYNTIASVGVFGSGFDITSKVFFVATIPPAAAVELVQATSFRSSGELFVAALDLTRCPGPVICPATASGASYGIRVKNSTGTSGTITYTVDANPPEASSLAPTSAYQGDSSVVTVTGTNLAGAVVQYLPPGGTFISAASTSSTATTATGTFDLVGSPPGSRPAGTYQVRLLLPSGAFSASLPFSVISNAAILQSISPASGMQGQNPVTVTLNVPNLRPPASGVTVIFSAQPGVPLATAAVNATAITTQLDLRNLAGGPYTLQVKNPNGAALSNPVNFTVTPGLPTLTGVTPASAAQQVALVPVTVNGTNFAKPDVSGANGSVIHLFANCTPVVVDLPGPPPTTQVTGCTCDGTFPCIPDRALDLTYNQMTVTSSTRIDLLIDTTAALPTTYSLWVWNPGGSPPPQRSNQLLDAFTVTP
jgi:hypothetical protein